MHESLAILISSVKEMDINRSPALSIQKCNSLSISFDTTLQTFPIAKQKIEYKQAFEGRATLGESAVQDCNIYLIEKNLAGRNVQSINDATRLDSTSKLETQSCLLIFNKFSLRITFQSMVLHLVSSCVIKTYTVVLE